MERVRDAARDGASLEQVKAMKPTLDYDPLYSVPEWTGEMLVEVIYNDLREHAPE